MPIARHPTDPYWPKDICSSLLPTMKSGLQVFWPIAFTYLWISSSEIRKCIRDMRRGGLTRSAAG